MSWINTSMLMQYLRSEFKLEWLGPHGAPHWGRVLRNGLLLAEAEGARIDVVKLFALLHDHKRHDDGNDRLHGERAVEAAELIRGALFDLDEDGWENLKFALLNHSKGWTGDSSLAIEIKVCWDADRLDLGRFRTRPLPQYLCTNTAKYSAFIEDAWQRSIRVCHSK